MIGGGGGGGYGGGGGGGGGGSGAGIYNYVLTGVSGKVFTYNIGAGGANGTASNLNGQNGNPTSFVNTVLGINLSVEGGHGGGSINGGNGGSVNGSPGAPGGTASNPDGGTVNEFAVYPQFFGAGGSAIGGNGGGSFGTYQYNINPTYGIGAASPFGLSGYGDPTTIAIGAGGCGGYPGAQGAIYIAYDTNNNTLDLSTTTSPQSNFGLINVTIVGGGGSARIINQSSTVNGQDGAIIVYY